ncbi:zinc-ribbon domain-containing protein, partial [Candidatus Parcubacteria bacterium]
MPLIKICPSCHTQNKNLSTFCINCGHLLPEQPQEAAVCPACGANVAPGLKFCTACGSPVYEKYIVQPADTPGKFPLVWTGIVGGIIL